MPEYDYYMVEYYDYAEEHAGKTASPDVYGVICKNVSFANASTVLVNEAAKSIQELGFGATIYRMDYDFIIVKYYDGEIKRYRRFYIEDYDEACIEDNDDFCEDDDSFDDVREEDVDEDEGW